MVCKDNNKTISKGTIFIKSLLTSLYQREELYPSLVKRGWGDFSIVMSFL
jgi:hypothetical protein